METNIKVHPSMESALFKPDKSNISVGRYTYGSPKCLTWSGEERIRIGSFCSIADEVSIFGGGEHRTDWITTFPLRIMFGLPGAWNDGIPCAKGETIVGNDVWIGYGAMILSGVTVGDGVVIGAGSVVTKDVPPYTIVGGNPAKFVKSRFDDETKKELLKIKWWEWPIEKILNNVTLLCSNDREAINEFVRLHRI